MRTTLLVLSALLTAGFVSADFGNDPPVPARKPVWYTGHWDTGIEIEIVYDLMCPDSAAMNPIFQQFLDMPFDSTSAAKVRDRIQLSYTFLPLPYHHEVWLPHKIVPYLLDTCLAAPDTCQFYNYMDFCFHNQDFILNGKDTSQDDLIQQWTAKVATAIPTLKQADLLNLYDSKKDTHNSEMRTRYMYKYNAHHHISGTPFAIVNGIILQDVPATAQDWMDMLTTVWSQTQGGLYYV